MRSARYEAEEVPIIAGRLETQQGTSVVGSALPQIGLGLRSIERVSGRSRAVYQEGLVSSDSLLVRRTWSLPSAFITKISASPSR